MTSSVLETARLNWCNANTPVSSQYDDVYFSADDGSAESRYVFIENNQLEQRFKKLSQSHFTIAETGFGTGLNFLQTWKLWRKYRKPGNRLFYISAECYPLHKNDLEKSLMCWPQFTAMAKQLLEHYPPPIRGLHCIELSDNITLLLLLDDAVSGFHSLIENQHPALGYDKTRAVDAWFLDGFAPSKNPEMWTAELFQCMASLSHYETSFASFTSAGLVRRGLQAAGFEVKKVKGFGKKRDMICGQYRGLPKLFEDIKPSPRNKPYKAFWPIYRKQACSKVKTSLIIGAGIAGVTTAKTLAEAGINVTLVDSNPLPMQEASGNPQGVLFPKLSHETSHFSEFNLFSLLYAQRFYQQTFFKDGFFQCGMLQTLLPEDLNNAKKLVERFSGIDNFVSLIRAKKASAIANTTIKHDCLWYPDTGWLRPASFQKAIDSIESVTFIGNCNISSLTKSATGSWLAHYGSKQLEYDSVIIANAFAAKELLPTLNLPLKNIRGQITQFASTEFDQLATVICHSGYICPTDSKKPDTYTCGASYELNDSNRELKQSSQQYNIETLKKFLPDFSHLQADEPDGRVNFRCSTPDYMPIIGPAPDTQAFITKYADYAKNGNAYIPQPGIYQDGLFVNIAYGSRGFSSAPIGAALIRAYLLEQCYPLPFEIIQSLNPARFIIRDIKRRKYG